MSIWDKIEAFFIGPVWTFIKPTVALIESQGGAILISAAEAGVAAGFASTGTAAMAIALKTFESQAVAAGVPFIESQARALIELALQKAKSSVPAAPAAPAISPANTAG